MILLFDREYRSGSGPKKGKGVVVLDFLLFLWILDTFQKATRIDTTWQKSTRIDKKDFKSM